MYVCIPGESLSFLQAHIGSTVQGLEVIMEHNVVDTINDLAERSVIPSMKGTCFYCLCLIAQTIPGVECLNKLNWKVIYFSM